jgi:uncharacterized membrane protein
MHPQLVLGFLVTLLPVFELRAGLPIVLGYAIKNSKPILPYFLVVLILNILAVILAFMFLDFLHKTFMKIKWYKKFADKILDRVQKKSKKLEKRMDKLGYLALMLFVSIPLPGTGAWTGALVAWTMGLNRKNSIMAISAGVIIAGLIMLLLSLGIFAL